jgi:hypothetical protein
MKNIVKESLKSLLPVQYDEMWEETADKFERELESKPKSVYNSVNQKMRMIDTNAVYKEFIHMYAQGYAPITKEFQEALAFTLEKQAEIGKYVHYNPSTCMVWVKGNEIQYSDKKTDTPTVVDSIDKLPEDIRGKMFVLDVSDKATFIEDIGMKAKDKLYWVVL